MTIFMYTIRNDNSKVQCLWLPFNAGIFSSSENECILGICIILFRKRYNSSIVFMPITLVF